MTEAEANHVLKCPPPFTASAFGAASAPAIT